MPAAPELATKNPLRGNASDFSVRKKAPRHKSESFFAVKPSELFAVAGTDFALERTAGFLEFLFGNLTVLAL